MASGPARPGPHPEPPADLARWRLPIVEMAGPWFRSYDIAHHPIYFGRSGANRFDAPPGEFGVLYAGDSPHCAFVESFAHETGKRLITVEELRQRGVVPMIARRLLRLVDLSGAGLARLGADATLSTGDYMIAQRWSKALHDHPDLPDGLRYRCRHDDTRLSFAISDRAADAIEVWGTIGSSFAEPTFAGLLADILETYGFVLLDGFP